MFKYAQHDASYVLQRATEAEFNEILRVLRNGLARLGEVGKDEREALKTNAVADSFLEAVRLWPHVNPSDLWYLVISACLLRSLQSSGRLLGPELRAELEAYGGLGAGASADPALWPCAAQARNRIESPFDGGEATAACDHFHRRPAGSGQGRRIAHWKSKGQGSLLWGRAREGQLCGAAHGRCTDEPSTRRERLRLAPVDDGLQVHPEPQSAKSR